MGEKVNLLGRKIIKYYDSIFLGTKKRKKEHKRDKTNGMEGKRQSSRRNSFYGSLIKNRNGFFFHGVMSRVLEVGRSASANKIEKCPKSWNSKFCGKTN